MSKLRKYESLVTVVQFLSASNLGSKVLSEAGCKSASIEVGGGMVLWMSELKLVKTDLLTST